MYAKVIKNDEQHAAALARLDELMDAEVETPEADELELLALLIATYEEQKRPRALPDPIEAIRFRMDQLSLRQKDLIPFIGSASRVSEVLNGKRALSLGMMRALHQGLGIPAEVLLQERGGQLPEEASGLDWRRFPVWEMVKRRWLPAASSASEAKERAEEYLRPFLAPMLREGLAGLQCRASLAGEVPVEVDYALLAWIARVMAVAGDEAIPAYRPGVVDAPFMSHLVQLSLYEEGPLLAKKFLHQNGIRFVAEPHLKKTKLDGAVILPKSGNPVIGMTLRHDRIDSFWFTLCHELGHVALHLGNAKEIVDLDVGGGRENQNEVEREANEFAENAIIAPEVWLNAGLLLRPNRAAVMAAAQRLRVHPALIAGRVRNELGDFRLFDDMLGHHAVRAALSLGC